MEKESGTNLKEDTLLGKIARLKADKKRLENTLSQQLTKIKQMEREEKSMMSEAQTLRAKIADLNGLISELKGKIEEQKAHEKQVITAYENQTDKLIAERNRLRKERDYYKEELHRRGKDVIDIDSVLEKIKEEEKNQKRWGLALREALNYTFTPKKLLIKLIQEMEEIENE